MLAEVAGWPRRACARSPCSAERQRLARPHGRRRRAADFALLLELVAEIPGIARIRYTTSHPNEFTQRLVDAYARVPQLVDHVHLPVQHGSDRILAAMKRGYTVPKYRASCAGCAGAPGIRIGNFIVGFPARPTRTSRAR